MKAERPASASAKTSANPLLLRRRMLDAVENACSACNGAPVPAATVVKLAPNLGLQARGITQLLRQIATLGPSEDGRQLIELRQRSSTALWAVLCGLYPDTPEPLGTLELQPYAAALRELALPGEPPEAAAARLLTEAIQVNRSLRQRAAAALAGGQPSAPAANPLPPPPLPQQKAPEQPTELRADPIQALISSAQARLDAPAPGLAALESALQQPPEPEPDDPMALAMAALAELNAEASR